VSATTTAGALRRSLAAVIPAAARANADLDPTLTAVMFEAGRGVALATATDRYVAAHARCEGQGDLPRLMVPLAGAKLLLAHLRTLDAKEEVTLEGDGACLFATTQLVRLQLLIVNEGSWYDSVAKVFGGDKGSRINLGKAPLASLNRVLAAVPRGAATRWRTSHPNAPVLIDVEDWLLIAVMPMLLDVESEARVQPVMFGLPAASAPKRGTRKATT